MSVPSELLHGGQCDLPESVAVCPECNSPLWIDNNEWNSKTGIPTQSGFSVSCFAEEEIADEWMNNDDDDRPWFEVGHRHHQSDWQPVHDAVWKWFSKLETKGGE